MDIVLCSSSSKVASDKLKTVMNNACNSSVQLTNVSEMCFEDMACSALNSANNLRVIFGALAACQSY